MQPVAALAGIEPDTRNEVATKKLTAFMARVLVNFLCVFIRPSDYRNMWVGFLYV
jgi:hypothetical protein